MGRGAIRPPHAQACCAVQLCEAVTHDSGMECSNKGKGPLTHPFELRKGRLPLNLETGPRHQIKSLTSKRAMHPAHELVGRANAVGESYATHASKRHTSRALRMHGSRPRQLVGPTAKGEAPPP